MGGCGSETDVTVSAVGVGRLESGCCEAARAMASLSAVFASSLSLLLLVSAITFGSAPSSSNLIATKVYPRSIARQSGVLPSAARVCSPHFPSLSLASSSSSASSSPPSRSSFRSAARVCPTHHSTIFKLSLNTARCTIVCPVLVRRCGSAPFATRLATTATLPCATAACSGVQPL